MPLVGTRSLDFAALDAPSMASLGTEPLALPGARVLQLLYEIPSSSMLGLLPPALHPTIPPTLFLVITNAPDSPFGPFTLAEARTGCRSAVRPRSLLLRAFVDNPDAARALRARWGYPVLVADVQLDRHYDRISASVVADGRELLSCALMNPEPISGSDIQYLANLNPARVPREGGSVERLVQVDPEFTFRTADRGKPRLDAYDPDAWLLPGSSPVWPVSASFATGELTLPALRFLVDPQGTPLASVERV